MNEEESQHTPERHFSTDELLNTMLALEAKLQAAIRERDEASKKRDEAQGSASRTAEHAIGLSRHLVMAEQERDEAVRRVKGMEKALAEAEAAINTAEEQLAQERNSRRAAMHERDSATRLQGKAQYAFARVVKERVSATQERDEARAEAATLREKLGDMSRELDHAQLAHHSTQDECTRITLDMRKALRERNEARAERDKLVKQLEEAKGELARMKPAASPLLVYSPATGKPFPERIPKYTPEQMRVMCPGAAWLFNPWTGELRDGRDVMRDPQGYRIDPPKPTVESRYESKDHGNPFRLASD